MLLIVILTICVIFFIYGIVCLLKESRKDKEKAKNTILNKNVYCKNCANFNRTELRCTEKTRYDVKDSEFVKAVGESIEVMFKNYNPTINNKNNSCDKFSSYYSSKKIANYFLLCSISIITMLFEIFYILNK